MNRILFVFVIIFACNINNVNITFGEGFQSDKPAIALDNNSEISIDSRDKYQDFEWLPDGSGFAVKLESGVALINIANSKKEIISEDTAIGKLRLSPDGKKIAYETNDSQGNGLIKDIDVNSRKVSLKEKINKGDGRRALRWKDSNELSLISSGRITKKEIKTQKRVSSIRFNEVFQEIKKIKNKGKNITTEEQTHLNALLAEIMPTQPKEERVVQSEVSPDGSTLAYVVSPDNFLYVKDLDTSEEKLVMKHLFGEIIWAPDSSKFFAAEEFLINKEGEIIKYYKGIAGGNCSWSPDSSKISFSVAIYDSSEEIVEADIYVMNADGSGRAKITNVPNRFEKYPKWSPDGKRIAFLSSNKEEDIQRESTIKIVKVREE